MQSDNKLNQEELDFFIKGNIALEKSSRKKPFPWLVDQGWEDVVKLSNIAPDVFASLCDDIERNEDIWKQVIWIEFCIYAGSVYVCASKIINLKTISCFVNNKIYTFS